MPVNWQNVSIDFRGGIDTKSDEKDVIPTQLTKLQNAQVTERGAIKKRNGFTGIPKTIADPYATDAESSLASGKSLATLNDELLLADGLGLYSFSESPGKWVRRGDYVPVSIEERVIASAADPDAFSDGPIGGGMAILKGIRAVAYLSYSGGAPWVEFYDDKTGALVLKECVGEGHNVSNNQHPLVIAMKNKIAVIYTSSQHSNDLKVSYFDPETLQLGSASTIYTGTVAYFNACIRRNTKEQIWVCVQDSASNAHAVFYADESGTASSTIDLTATVGAAATDCCPALMGALDGDVTVVAKDSSNNIDAVRLNYANPPTVDGSANSAIFSDADIVSLALFCTDGGPSFQGTYIYAGYDTTSGRRDECYIERAYRLSWGGFGVTGSNAAELFKQRAEIASNPFNVAAQAGDGTYGIHLWTYNAQDAGDGGCYILCRDVGGISAGRPAVDIGMVLPGKAYGPFAAVGATYRPVSVDTTDGLTYRCALMSLIRQYDGGGTYDVHENQLTELSVTFDEAPVFSRFADILLLSGGFLHMYDGRYIREAGFLNIPATFAAANLNLTSSGSMTPSSTYAYKLLYKYTDSTGRVHLSAESDSASRALGGANTSVEVSAPIYQRGLDDRSDSDNTLLNNIRVDIYRTEADGSVYYSIGDTADSTTDTMRVVVEDTLADSDLTNNALLYTESGEVQNDAVQSCRSIAVANNRAFVATSGGQIRYSKKEAAGVGASFPLAFEKQLSGRDNETVIVGALDDKIIVFRERAISYFYGDGPNVLGQGSFSDELQLSSDVGCISAPSVLSTHLGLFFQSKKGIRLLTRGLQVHPQIGKEVDNLLEGKIVKSATLIQDKDECRFLLDDRVLVYNYELNQWGEMPLDGRCGASATNWRGKYALLCANGQVSVENDGYKDDGLPYSLSVGTAWIKMGGPQGFQRVRRFSVLGTKSSKHTLNVKVYYDYEDKPSDVFYFTSKDGVPAGSDVLQYTRRLTRQKCSAIRFEFEDEDLSESGEGYSISDLTLEVAVKGGINRNSTGRSFSVTNGWSKVSTSTAAHGGHQHRHQYQGGNGGGQGQGGN